MIISPNSLPSFLIEKHALPEHSSASKAKNELLAIYSYPNLAQTTQYQSAKLRLVDYVRMSSHGLFLNAVNIVSQSS